MDDERLYYYTLEMHLTPTLYSRLARLVKHNRTDLLTEVLAAIESHLNEFNVPTTFPSNQ